MSDFADRPFAVGTLTGLRAFRVDNLGRLRAPQQGTIWKPGENVAECRRGKAGPYTRGGIIPSGAYLTASFARSMWIGDEVEKPDDKHRPGSLGCGCGFYAYTDGRNDYYESDKEETVEALVEGYGLATVGSRGFRSEKSRLVALIDPPANSGKDPGKLTRREWLRLVGLAAAMFGVLALGVFLNVTFPHTWVRIAVGLGSGGGLGLLAGEMTSVVRVARSRRRSVTPPIDLTETLRLYPGVKVYKSRAEALAAHPLTVPPKPDPETAEDFWTNTGLTA